MLSYKHSFHAGNFADVHKHISLAIALKAMSRKDKPFCYMDTHAGAGLYNLKGDQAQKNREFKRGISPLYASILNKEASEARSVANVVKDYLQVIKQYNVEGLSSYPGSPLIAQSCLREQDEMVLMELHSAEARKLKQLFEGGDQRVHEHHRDGLEGMVAMLPPQQRRGVVLIDPSYEMKSEYQAVKNSVIKAHKRWQQGVYMIWYPLLAEQRHLGLITELQRSGIRKIFHSQYLKSQESEGAANKRTAGQAKRIGMHGSGMIVINPPWKFAEQSHSTFQMLVKNWFPEDRFVGEWLVPE